MKTRQQPLFLLLLFFFAFGFLLSNNYRDYIYSNGIYDFGIADAGANLFVVPILSIFMFISQPKLDTTTVVLRVTFFYSIAEIASIIFPMLGVFDIADLIAYLVGANLIMFTIKRLKVVNRLPLR